MGSGKGRLGRSRGKYKVKEKSGIPSGELHPQNVAIAPCVSCGKLVERSYLEYFGGYCDKCQGLAGQRKMRPCLRCGRMFKSMSKANRRCCHCHALVLEEEVVYKVNMG